MSIHPKNAILKTAIVVTSIFTTLQPISARAVAQPTKVCHENDQKTDFDERFLPSNKAPFIMPKKVEIHYNETEEILY